MSSHSKLSQDQYLLTINRTGNGTVTKDPDQATYTYGTLVELTATPDIEWDFSYWSGDLSGSGNPITINMISDKEVTAHFTENEYTLTINIDGSGSAIKDPDQNTYPNETVITLTAVADVGWKFSGWSGDLTGSTNPDNITMDGNTSVTAKFAKKKSSNGDDDKQNIPPLAVISGIYKGFPGDSILFDGSQSYDPDGIITTFLWNLGDGTTLDGNFVNHTYTKQGNYNASLTVIDNNESSNTTSIIVYIIKANNPPELNLHLENPLGELTIKLIINVSDKDGDIVNCEINWDDNSSPSLFQLSNNSKTTIHTYPAFGSYNIYVTVNDGSTETSETVSLIITKEDTNGIDGFNKSISNFDKFITNLTDFITNNSTFLENHITNRSIFGAILKPEYAIPVATILSIILLFLLNLLIEFFSDYSSERANRIIRKK
ncbi:repeat-containing protein [Thermoplasmatales archaeon SCGC AB-540-F20]|nr:repeat-containing protein [Thermoplasmatales archaeon SCGC AB-540-F20]